MASLLRSCTKIQSLAICFAAGRTTIEDLPMHFLTALLDSITRPTLDHLELWGQGAFHIPNSLLHLATVSVRRLALRRINIGPAQNVGVNSVMEGYLSSSAVRMEHLSVDLVGRSSITHDHLIVYEKIGFLQRLQKLTIVQWSDRFIPLLEASASTILELQIALGGQEFTFPHFRFLQTAELRIDTDDTFPVPTVIEHLLSFAPQLQNLTLFFGFTGGIDLTRPSAPWVVFSSDALVKRRLSVTCAIAFSRRFLGDQALAYAQFVSWIGAQMPALVGTPFFECVPMVPEKYASWDAWPQ
ncbi:hypothetical protein C8R43DRAFT_1034069 [Mycena crocata]|nr:hypothetical protein C8R43DRAFT_1034069 [Mycena crocata]